MKNLTLIWLLLSLHGNSQSVNCRLKPPALTIHFGRGNVRDVNTAALANYERVSHFCPNDGHYTYTSYTSDCFRGDWHTLMEDHTPGDVDGNVLLVNASYDGGTFFTTMVNGLKAGTTYEFGVWIMNVCRITDKCPFPLLPNITIRLQTSSGKTIAQFNTGEVPRQPAPYWTQHRARFTTPPSNQALRLIMVDNTPGGCGNDFAMDDITFRECVPKPTATITPKTRVVVKQKPPAPKTNTKTTTQTTQKKQPEVPVLTKREANAPVRDTAVIKRTLTVFPAPPPVLTQRLNTTIKHFETEPGEIRLDLFDNGEIDGDTVSIYHNNTLVIANAKLSQKPITLHIAVNPSNPHHELVMVAENLGSIPPNTSLMIVTAGSKRYQVFISSTEQKNGKVVFDLKQ